MQLTRDQTFQVVLNLRTPLPKGGEQVGTGIFIIKGDSAFILTATHVAADCDASTLVLIIDAGSRGRSFGLPLFNAALSWKHHSVADVSVLELSRFGGRVST